MRQEIPVREPQLAWNPRTLAVAVTIPLLLLAFGALWYWGDGVGSAPGLDGRSGEPPPEPEGVAASFAAFLEKRPDSPVVTGLAHEGEREVIHQALLELYRENGYRPVWFEDRRLRPQAREMVEALRRARLDGLTSATYRPDELERRLGELDRWTRRPKPREIYPVDTLLSQAFLVYGKHLATGRIEPASLGPSWHIEPRRPDLAAALDRVVESGEVEPVVERLRPPHPAYDALRDALARYREIHRAGGWPRVPEGPVLSPGDRADPRRLRALAARLEVEGDLAPGSWQAAAPAERGRGEREGAGRAVYDVTLARAVGRFQARHGIVVDGKLGPETNQTLNLSASHRVRQIELNLERRRWLPADLGSRRVEVNLPAYLLHAIDGDRVVQTMKVVVGKEGAATPAFSDTMSYVVINPYWNVPDGILAEEIAPAAMRDPGYLAANDMEVVAGWGESERTVSPYSVDWSGATGGDWEYRVRQRPGPKNSLGEIKFMFPNDHNIYLHDTPATHLFEETERTFSHGCIRVERPLDLAAFVFQGDSEWSRARVRAAIDSGRQLQVDLPRDVPVYLLYWTAWVGEAGTVHFRNDIYGHDRALDQALDRLRARRAPERVAAGR